MLTLQFLAKIQLYVQGQIKINSTVILLKSQSSLLVAFDNLAVQI